MTYFKEIKIGENFHSKLDNQVYTRIDEDTATNTSPWDDNNYAFSAYNQVAKF